MFRIILDLGSVQTCFYPVIVLLSFIFVASDGSVGFGGELRPYQLPSQQRPIYQHQAQPNVAAPSPDAWGSFDYESYGQRVSRLSPEDRQQLKEGLQQKYSEAMRNNNNSEANHYARLIHIVENLR